MSIRFIIILFFFTNVSIAQTIGQKLDSLSFQAVSSITNFDSLRSVCVESKNDDYIGFYHKQYKDRVIYDVKNELFLFPIYDDSVTIVAFNIYSILGTNMMYWNINSIAFDGHRITYYRKQKKTLIIGYQKGIKYKYHRFNKGLFSSNTMMKTVEEFNQMVQQIIKRW